MPTIIGILTGINMLNASESLTPHQKQKQNNNNNKQKTNKSKNKHTYFQYFSFYQVLKLYPQLK